MTFQSLEYLFFLPVVFILYWTLCRGSKSLQNGLIVAAGLVFYGWWNLNIHLLSSKYMLVRYLTAVLLIVVMERRKFPRLSRLHYDNMY